MAERNSSNRTTWRFAAVLAGALIAAFFATGVVATQQPASIHAAIAAWEQEHPGQQVPLIIQHTGDASDVVAYVRASGGTVDREFHIVPAVDVSVPAGAIAALEQRSDVTWVSLDAPIQSTSDISVKPTPTKEPPKPTPTEDPKKEPPMDADPEPAHGHLGTTYPQSVRAPQAWGKVTGAGVTVALIDTGISPDASRDFITTTGASRVSSVSVRSDIPARADGFGHGTHVGGIIAGRSTAGGISDRYTGIAPGSKLLAVRVADDEGNATVGDLMAGLQFVDDNRSKYGIKVLNLSVTSSVAQSYKVDPIDAAVELLWFHGVVVVVASGNDGTDPDAVMYPPANDPFVIVVGATDDKRTTSLSDDSLAPWSSRGTTQDGFAKPDVLAPGANITSPVSRTSYLAQEYPEAIAETVGNTSYFNMSGTSMSTGVVSGVVALMRQEEPKWSPGQIKYILMKSARALSTGGGKTVQADKAAFFNNTVKSSDDGLTPNYLLLAAAGINSANFSGIRWRDADFSGIRWRGISLNGIRWRQIDWTGIRWRGVNFNSARFGGLSLDGIRWRGLRWRAIIDEN